MSRKTEDLTGKRFGKLTVIGRDGTYPRKLRPRLDKYGWQLKPALESLGVEL